MILLDSVKSYFQRNTPIDSEGVKMDLLEPAKRYIQKTTSVDNIVKFGDLVKDTEQLGAVGILEDDTFVFMINPIIAEERPYVPLNKTGPGLESGNIYDLFSDSYVTIKLKDGEVEKLQTTFKALERRVASNTLVFPMRRQDCGIGFISTLLHSQKIQLS